MANRVGRKKVPRSLSSAGPPVAGVKVDRAVTSTPPAEALAPPMKESAAGLNQTAAGSETEALTAEALPSALPERS